MYRLIRVSTPLSFRIAAMVLSLEPLRNPRAVVPCVLVAAVGYFTPSPGDQPGNRKPVHSRQAPADNPKVYRPSFRQLSIPSTEKERRRQVLDFTVFAARAGMKLKQFQNEVCWPAG